MKNVIAPVKNFVHLNKRALIVGATLTTVIVIQHKGIKSLNEFLKEHDLLDKYYLPEGEL